MKIICIVLCFVLAGCAGVSSDPAVQSATSQAVASVIVETGQLANQVIAAAVPALIQAATRDMDTIEYQTAAGTNLRTIDGRTVKSLSVDKTGKIVQIR